MHARLDTIVTGQRKATPPRPAPRGRARDVIAMSRAAGRPINPFSETQLWHRSKYTFYEKYLFLTFDFLTHIFNPDIHQDFD